METRERVTDAPEAPETGVERLVVAEEEWRERTEATASDCERLVAEARAASDAALAALEVTLRDELERHRAAVTAALEREVVRLRDASVSEVARYESVSDERVRAIAARIARLVLWPGAADGARS